MPPPAAPIMSQPAHLAFHPKGPASHLLLGGLKGDRLAGLSKGSTVLFWWFEAARAQAALDAAVTLTAWAKGMYLEAVENAIAPMEGWPSKRAKITNVDTDEVTEVARTGQAQGDSEEARVNPKGKGKAHANAMEVDKVIVINEAEGKIKEWDGLT